MSPLFHKIKGEIKYIKFEIFQIVSSPEDVKFSNVRGLYLRKYGIFLFFFSDFAPPPLLKNLVETKIAYQFNLLLSAVFIATCNWGIMYLSTTYREKNRPQASELMKS